MQAAIALTIIGVILLGAVGLGIWGVRRVRMDPQQLIVGGRDGPRAARPNAGHPGVRSVGRERRVRFLP